MRKAQSIDSYIKGFPKSTQRLLRQLRRTIQKAAPSASETIKYGIPTFSLNGNLVHFAAFEHHIGFYPTPSAIKAFKRELSRYPSSKGGVQFPVDQPLPLVLVRKMVEFRVAEADPFHALAAPARRALADARMTSLAQLAKKSEGQIFALHGMGPDALNKLRSLLHANGLKFRQDL
jgi:uncharacterized protein YdhG (YjbR/CyaY superfamily)